MNHRDRLCTALNHQEPDHVPFDLGARGATGIHIEPYRQLREYLGLPATPIRCCDKMQQLACIDEDVMDALDCCAYRLDTLLPTQFASEEVRTEGKLSYRNEWGITFEKPDGGFWFDPIGHPLAKAESAKDIDAYAWPNATDPSRFIGVADTARALHSRNRGIAMGSIHAGLFETGTWLRGYETFCTDLLINPDIVEAIAENVMRVKIDYWNTLLPLVNNYVLIIGESDDLGTQLAPLIPLELYRKYFRNRHRKIFDTIKSHGDFKIHFHSCGAIRQFLPDLIEAGIDILNPVQVSAAGMDTRALKKDFGQSLSFWGGGCDTQSILPNGTRDSIRYEVQQRIDDLAPGGGFVFNPVHNIQVGVTPRNFMIMWEAWQEFGTY